MQSSSWEDRQLEVGHDTGLSMIATVLSLVATALLVALLLGNSLHSGSAAKPSVANAPGVGQANELQAQQALSTGLTSAAAASATAGGLGSLDISTLSAADPSISFVTGPSVNASTVSVVVSSDAAGGGSITMADRSSDGICWLVWKAAGGATWLRSTDRSGQLRGPCHHDSASARFGLLIRHRLAGEQLPRGLRRLAAGVVDVGVVAGTTESEGLTRGRVRLDGTTALRATPFGTAAPLVPSWLRLRRHAYGIGMPAAGLEVCDRSSYGTAIT